MLPFTILLVIATVGLMNCPLLRLSVPSMQTIDVPLIKDSTLSVSVWKSNLSAFDQGDTVRPTDPNEKEESQASESVTIISLSWFSLSRPCPSCRNRVSLSRRK